MGWGQHNMVTIKHKNLKIDLQQDFCVLRIARTTDTERDSKWQCFFFSYYVAPMGMVTHKND